MGGFESLYTKQYKQKLPNKSHFANAHLFHFTLCFFISLSMTSYLPFPDHRLFLIHASPFQILSSILTLGENLRKCDCIYWVPGSESRKAPQHVLYCNFSASLNRNIAQHVSKCSFTGGCQMKCKLITICSMKLYSIVALKELKNWCIHSLCFVTYVDKLKILKKEKLYI